MKCRLLQLLDVWHRGAELRPVYGKGEVCGMDLM